MNSAKRTYTFLAFTIAFIVIVIDQLADWHVDSWLSKQDINAYLVTPFFNLVRIHNTGISFGLLQDILYGKWILLGLALVITSFLVSWLFRTSSICASCALGFIIGGAMGNMIERIRDGAVFDFLDFHAFGRHWPAFNITDTAIVAGVFLLILQDVFRNLKAENGMKRVSTR